MRTRDGLAAALYLVLSLFASSPAHAISESSFSADFDSQVLKYFEASGTPGEFAGVDGVAIRYRKFEVAESMIQYAELIYDLRDQGYSIYLLDHRGQGFSGRMTHNSEIGYVSAFHYYVTDLETFVSTVVNARAHKRKLLLGQGMGGAIATLYLARNPAQFDRAALSSPMLDVDTGKTPKLIRFATAGSALIAGRGKKFARGQGGYDPEARFEDNRKTGSQTRFMKMKELIANHPETALGGVSNGWIVESILATWKLDTISKKLHTPVLVLQAGQDPKVLRRAQNRFCARTRQCRKLVLRDSFHDILMERDPIRDAALTEILDFFETP
jgi:lysophospholipase